MMFGLVAQLRRRVFRHKIDEKIDINGAVVVNEFDDNRAASMIRVLEQPVVVVRKLTNNIDSKRAASM
ncbi:MAG: hypothetical protein MPK08_04450, partial [Alphaproteobacteria bacterium]|nr:hypothetical protein [Alphaproteobacteria bacterium]